MPGCRNESGTQALALRLRRRRNSHTAPNGSRRLEVGFGEDVSGEAEDGGAVSPGVWGESGFEAGLGEEFFTVPSPFHGDLGKEESVIGTLLNHEAVFAKFDFLD